MGNQTRRQAVNMQYNRQKVLFIFLFTICYVNGGGSRSHKSIKHPHLSNKDACPILEKQLKKSETEVAKDEAFRDYLIERNITIQPDEPAFIFFNNVPLSEKLSNIYHESSIVFEVSERYANRLFNNNPPRSRNINPLLRKNSCCLHEYFKTFCVDNKHYKCDKKQKYRRIDGYCTNLNCPKEGAAGTPFVSFLDQNYDDSISKFRKEAYTHARLPLARELSSALLDNCKNDSFLENGPSTAGTQIGVFITQDIIALAYPRSSPSLTCCKKDYSTILPAELLHSSCSPIRIPKNDKFFGPKGITCMNFLRTQNGYDNNCVLSSREQLNIVTSFLDLSQIYGNEKVVTTSIRSFADGLLKTNAANKFPEDANGNLILSDFRAAASPPTAMFNILFIREHNRIAKILKSKFASWNDETLFQEARRWNIAEYQYIVFEWMKIFVPEQYKHLRIKKHTNGKVCSTTSNEFGHAIFRQHHKLVTETVQLFDENGSMVQEIFLSDSDAFALIRNSYSNLARSLFYQKQNYNGCHNQIRNLLFKSPAGVGIDLFAFDIKRGRDHGLQPYYKYVELCLKKKVNSFSDLKFIISEKHIKQLRQMYDSVYDIDLYIGVRLEKRPYEFQFGPIGSCIANEQFYRYRHGDSFFYDNPKQNYPFTAAQLAEIRKASFSRILCDNGDIKKVSKDAFMAQTSKNPIVTCDSVPVVNIVY